MVRSCKMSDLSNLVDKRLRLYCRTVFQMKYFFQLSFWISSMANFQDQPFKTEVTMQSVGAVFRREGVVNKVIWLVCS